MPGRKCPCAGRALVSWPRAASRSAVGTYLPGSEKRQGNWEACALEPSVLRTRRVAEDKTLLHLSICEVRALTSLSPTCPGPCCLAEVSPLWKAMWSQFYGPQSPASKVPTKVPKGGACPLWPCPAVSLPGARWTQSQGRTFTPKRWGQLQTWPLKALNVSVFGAERWGQHQGPHPSPGSSRAG